MSSSLKVKESFKSILMNLKYLESKNIRRSTIYGWNITFCIPGKLSVKQVTASPSESRKGKLQ